MVFSSIFGGGSNSPPQIRPMEQGDLGAVLRIIHQYDEDDFEEAREHLRENSEGMMVITKGGKVVGMTGAEPDPQGDSIAWLSWTYIDRQHAGQGLGRQMVDGLLHTLRQEGFRKLFISTSDYKDEGEDIYAAARKFYEKIGAKLEVVIPDYHAPGENRYMYGLDLIPPPSRDQHPEGGCLRFSNIEEAPESEGGLALTWDMVETQAPPASVDSNLGPLVQQARSRGARILVAAVPSDLCANIGEPLQTAGFQHHGRLLDYFEPNVHQELGVLRLK